jgi:hypothetical protein
VPFYVGKGTKKRAWQHLSRTDHHPFVNKLRKMLGEGVQPEIEIIRALDEGHAYFLEKCLIQVIGRQDLKTGPLTNLTDGGDGLINMSPEAYKARGAKLIGRKHSDERRKNESEAAKRRPTRTLSEEHKAAVSVKLTGHEVTQETRALIGEKVRANAAAGLRKKPVTKSDEHREKLRQAQIGRVYSPEARALMSQKAKARCERARLAKLVTTP